MKPRVFSIVWVLVVLINWACENQGSNKSTTETKKMVEIDDDDELQSNPNFAKLLDQIENYILTEYLTERDLRKLSKNQRKFQLYQIDLNNDGKQEIFIRFFTSYFCEPDGCDVVLLNDRLKPITKFSLMGSPIYIEETTENDWKTIKVQSNGKWRTLVYDGHSYPSNPSLLKLSQNPPNDNAVSLFDPKLKKPKTYSF